MTAPAPFATRPVEESEIFDVLRLLRGIAQFDRFTNDELTSVAVNLKAADLPKDGVVCTEGDAGDAMFLVRSGEVAIRKEGKDRSSAPVTLAILPPGAIVGEMSLLDGAPRSASVVAHTDLSLIVLDRACIDDLALIDEALACNFLIAVIKTACGKIRASQESLIGSIAELTARGAAGR